MTTDDFDAGTPDQHRARYLALMRQAAAKRAELRPEERAARRNPDRLPDTLLITEETIPGGWYATLRLARGESLRIIDTTGRSAVAVLLWNADDTSERYNAGDTVKIQWTARLGRGRVLFSDMGRVLASITDDTSGHHDALMGVSDAALTLAKYGPGRYRNGHDNLLLAAAKLGLGPRDVPPCLTLFAPVGVDEAGRFHWVDGNVKQAGAFVDLRAEMNLLVALSNTPHPLDPSPRYAPGPVAAIRWRSPPPPADDLCRHATEEAVRGFENTDPSFVEVTR